MKDKYNGSVTIELNSLGESKEEAEKKINDFLDWLDVKTTENEIVKYDSTDYKIKKTTEQAWEVGAILYVAWGYDQTNCDFYEVVDYTPSKKSVRLRTLGNKQVEGSRARGTMSCYAEPDLENKGEKILTRRVLHNGQNYPYVKIAYGQYAHTWDGTPKYWSWYG